MKTNDLTIKERLSSPTPSFFKKVRNVGLVLGAIGGALLAAPVTLPAVVTTIAGYLATAGLVASAVSVTAVEGSGVTKKEFRGGYQNQESSVKA